MCPVQQHKISNLSVLVSIKLLRSSWSLEELGHMYMYMYMATVNISESMYLIYLSGFMELGIQ